MPEQLLRGQDGLLTQAGATATVLIDGGQAYSWQGKTLFIVPGGPGYSEIVVEGSLPDDDSGGETVWLRALTDIAVDPVAPGVYVIGAAFRALRVVGTGGAAESTLRAGLMG